MRRISNDTSSGRYYQLVKALTAGSFLRWLRRTGSSESLDRHSEYSCLDNYCQGTFDGQVSSNRAMVSPLPLDRQRRSQGASGLAPFLRPYRVRSACSRLLVLAAATKLCFVALGT